MKSILFLIFVTLFFSNILFAQDLEVDGTAKVSELSEDNNADSLVVVLPDGTLGVRTISSIQEMIDQAILNFGLVQGQKGVQALLDAGYVLSDILAAGAKVQTLLSYDISPLEIFDAGMPKDSIYGKTYQGGLIFYLDDLDALPGVEGMVAVPMDQGTLKWGCEGTMIVGADGELIGTGDQNTTDIFDGCNGIDNQFAAKECINLDLNSYSDWFLPSLYELREMHQNIGQGAPPPLTNLGGFADVDYWSSTEVEVQGSNPAWKKDFGDGTDVTTMKSSNLRVRAVRAF